jgi:hypothetical protein
LLIDSSLSTAIAIRRNTAAFDSLQKEFSRSLQIVPQKSFLNFFSSKLLPQKYSSRTPQWHIFLLHHNSFRQKRLPPTPPTSISKNFDQNFSKNLPTMTRPLYLPDGSSGIGSLLAYLLAWWRFCGGFLARFGFDEQ